MTKFREPSSSNSEPERLPVEIGPWDEKAQENLIDIESLKPVDKEKERKESIEKAKKELRSLMAAKEEDKDQSYYLMAGKLYRDITGEDLEYNAKKEAQSEARREGHRVLSKAEYLNETNIKKAQQWFKNKERSEYWENLPEHEKKNYSDVNEYIEVKRKKMADNLGLPLMPGEKGFSLSTDAVFEMIKKGFNPEDIKEKGWFFKKIEIPPSGEGPSIKMSKAEFKKWVERLEAESEKRTREGGGEELYRIIAKGDERAKERREKHMREMMQKVVAEEKPERGPEQKPLDLKELGALKEALGRFEGGISYGDVVLKTVTTDTGKKVKEVESFSKKSKKIEPLSEKEVISLQKLGLLGQEETGKISARKIAGFGDILGKKLKDITQKSKMGRSPSAEELEFFHNLKELLEK